MAVDKQGAEEMERVLPPRNLRNTRRMLVRVERTMWYGVMEPNRIRRVARGFDLDDVIEGVEKARIGGWIVFAALSESFEFDGWVAVRERDVVADDVHGESLAIARILNLRHQVEPEFGDGDVWTAISDQWSDHGLVAVHVEHEFPGECQIGAGSITDGVVELRTVDMCGAFEDAVVHIAVSTITRLDWGGRYEEALCLAGQAQHEPPVMTESFGHVSELRLDGAASETVCGFVVRRFVDWVVVNAMNDRVDLDGFVAVPARRVLSDVVSERGDFYSRVVRHRGQAPVGITGHDMVGVLAELSEGGNLIQIQGSERDEKFYLGYCTADRSEIFCRCVRPDGTLEEDVLPIAWSAIQSISWGTNYARAYELLTQPDADSIAPCSRRYSRR